MLMVKSFTSDIRLLFFEGSVQLWLQS